MSPEMIVIIVALLLDVVVIVVCGVWVVAKIKTTTAVLGTTLDHVGETLNKVANKVDNHGDRIARIEASRER